VSEYRRLLNAWFDLSSVEKAKHRYENPNDLADEQQWMEEDD